MSVNFFKAKNGEYTASVSDINIHSSYNPSREADRFINNLQIKKAPTLFILLEPGIGYIYDILHLRYPNSKIAAIRYSPDFSNFDSKFDYIINYYNQQINISSYLYSLFGEELLMDTLFIEWQPTAQIYNNIHKNVLNEIKKLLELCKTLLITREYFEQKWFINTVNFLNYTKNLYKITNKINKPVVILSSGPSLSGTLEILRTNRKKIFLLVLSSAIKLAIENNLIPDLCLSTDGGYWAGQHLKVLEKNNIPLAVPIEGYVPKKILSTNTIIPLSYNDGTSFAVLNNLNLHFTLIERNGTVTGSALKFAQSLTTSQIFLLGVDMSTQTGFQHFQPNEIETNNKLNDTKITSCEKRNCAAQFSTSTFNLYKEWFASLNCNNVYRVIDEKFRKNSLGKIKDINIDSFEKKLNYLSVNDKTFDYKNINLSIDKQELLNIIISLFNQPDFIKELFPLSYSALSHNENNQIISTRIDKSLNLLKRKIRKILYD